MWFIVAIISKITEDLYEWYIFVNFVRIIFLDHKFILQSPYYVLRYTLYVIFPRARFPVIIILLYSSSLARKLT